SALSQQVAQNSLKPERTNMSIQRYQRGFVYQRGKHKIWYGKFREDQPDPDGKRRQFNIRLGPPSELPTKNAARAKLAEIMGAGSPSGTAKSGRNSLQLTFRELVDRWEKAEGPAMKPSTLAHYLHSLKVVLSSFSERKLDTITRESVQSFLN